jgi:spore coat protein U-like protein
MTVRMIRVGTPAGAPRRRTAGLPGIAMRCVTAACFTLAAQCCLAACSITATPVVFGAYNVYSVTANDGGIGTLRVRCTGGSRGTVTLSTGQSGSYAARVMNSGTNLLGYNLYISAARTSIWGDGLTGGTASMPVARNATTRFSIYGRIPAGQDAAAGNYLDGIVATVTF